MNILAIVLALAIQSPDPGQPHHDDADGLQALIDSAPPGATLIVPSGNYRSRTIILRRSIKLLGETPRPRLGRVSLAGYGGSVTLANFTVGHFYYPDAEARFDELRVHDVEVTDSEWGNQLNARAYVEAARVRANSETWLVLVGMRALAIDCEAAGVFGGMTYVGEPEFRILTAPRLGGALEMEWNLAAPAARLFGHTATRSPQAAVGFGAWHLAGGRWLDIAVASPGGMSVAVPSDSRLVGMTTAFQMLGSDRRLSRPAVAMVLP